MTLRYHLTLIKMVTMKKTTCIGEKLELSYIGEELGPTYISEELGPSYIAGGNVNCCTHFGKQYGSSSKS